ncbi:hypothetical protein LSH36_209g04049, partial [Paralvinella palmiformis]
MCGSRLGCTEEFVFANQLVTMVTHKRTKTPVGVIDRSTEPCTVYRCTRIGTGSDWSGKEGIIIIIIINIWYLYNTCV